MTIRKIDVELSERVETGPTQIGDDWPGVFIRGDNAAYYAFCLENYMKDNCPADPFMMATIRDLLRLLQGCRV
jgi:hypothetical protein